MEAGRELDALVAEKVMGWKADLNKHNRWVVVDGEGDRREAHDKAIYYHSETGEKVEEPWWDHIHPPDYSGNIAATLEVIEKMRGLGYEFALIADEQRPDVLTYAAEFDKYNGNIGETTYIHGQRADTAPLAICLAALKAVGVEVPTNA